MLDYGAPPQRPKRNRDAEGKRTPDQRADDYVRMQQQLESERMVPESAWRTVYKYIIPERYAWWSNTGMAVWANIFDSTGPTDNEKLAGAIHDLITNRQSKWFTYTFDDVDQPEQGSSEESRWADSTARRQREGLEADGFYSSLSEIYQDLAGPGQAALMIDEVDRRPMYSARHIGEVWLIVNAHGVVNGVHRKFKLKAYQAVEMFDRPDDDVHDEIVKAAKNPETRSNEYEFLHVVTGRQKLDPSRNDPINRPVADCYVDVQHKCIVREGGHHEWPWMTPRWKLAAGGTYGSGPGVKALPDILSLNVAVEEGLKASERAGNPSIFAPNDGYIAQPTNAPGHTNYYDASGGNPNERIMAWPAAVNMPVMVQQQQRHAEQIHDAYYIDLLQLRNGPQMTATEVNARMDQKLSVLELPMGRVVRELIVPALVRDFGIRLRAGEFDPIPDSVRRLQGQMRIKWMSPFMRALMANEADALPRFVAKLGPLLERKPELLDVIDVDAEAVRVARGAGIRESSIRDVDAVTDMRATRAATQGLQDAVTAAPGVAGAALDAAKAAQLLGGADQGTALPPLP